MTNKTFHPNDDGSVDVIDETNPLDVKTYTLTPDDLDRLEVLRECFYCKGTGKQLKIIQDSFQCETCRYQSSGGQTTVCQYYGKLEIDPDGNCPAFEP